MINVYSTDTIVNEIQKLSIEKLTKMTMKSLYEYCKLSSGLLLKHPALIYLKWMTQDEFDKAIENLEE